MGQDLWQSLAGLPSWQVTEVPRPDGTATNGNARDGGAVQRVSALASAYGCGVPVAVAWVRDRPGGPVRVLIAGPGLAGGTDASQVVLTLPAGARGVALPDGGTARVLAALPCWTRIEGVTDVLLADDVAPRTDERVAGPSLEEGLLPTWLDAFAWLLLAEPVEVAEIREMAKDAASAQLAAEQYSHPRAKLAARRSAARHDELRQAATTGLWRVHLLAGAAAPDAATRIARLICTSTDLRGLPYALAVSQHADSLPAALTATISPVRTRHQMSLPVVPVPDADDRSWWDRPMGAGPQGDAPAPPGQWPDTALAAVVHQAADDEGDSPEPTSPFYGSTALVAALARPPAMEVPGLRFALRPTFDVTPETTLDSGAESVIAGTVLDRNRVPAGALAIPLASLNRHVFVTGATGAGKSQTVRNLLEQATGAGIPWLVVEPAKAEYRLMAGRLPDSQVICIRPGDLTIPPAGINPLEPALGPGRSRFPLQTHADLLRALFLAAFQADEPFPQVLSAALTRCYEQDQWDLVTGQQLMPGAPPAYPGLEDLQAAALAVVDETGYGHEVRDNVRGFVSVRIGSLRLGTTGRFLNGAHPLDFGKLLDANVVLEIEDIGDDRDKAFLMGIVLIRLTEHLRLRQRHEGAPSGRLRHLTVVEEAHRLLRQPPPGASTGPAAHATEMFADLLAEVRAYGEGLIIAEQIPAKLIPDVIRNTAVKIVHRLPALDDRDTVGATMNLTPEQSEYLVTLPPGEAAAHADMMDYPLLVRIPDGTAREAVADTVTASPEPVIGRRSPTCGTDCLDRPCTLGQMRAAQHEAITDTRLTLWAELTVIGHLTAWEMPRPTQAFTDALHDMDTRLRDCAIAHTVDAAVAARASVISIRVSPPALAVHAAACMRQAVADGTRPCAAQEPQYLAPPWRWSLVRTALKSAARAGGGRDPRSDLWEATYGRPIPGKTVGHQFRTVSRWLGQDQLDTRQVNAVLWGTRSHPALERAVGTTATSSDWLARFTESLTAFTRLTWPRHLLLPDPTTGASDE